MCERACIPVHNVRAPSHRRAVRHDERDRRISAHHVATCAAHTAQSGQHSTAQRGAQDRCVQFTTNVFAKYDFAVHYRDATLKDASRMVRPPGPAPPRLGTMSRTARYPARHGYCARHGRHTRHGYRTQHGIPHGTVSRTARYPTRHGLVHDALIPHGMVPARHGHRARRNCHTRHGIPRGTGIVQGAIVAHGTVSHTTRYPARHGIVRSCTIRNCSTTRRIPSRTSSSTTSPKAASKRRCSPRLGQSGAHHAAAPTHNSSVDHQRGHCSLARGRAWLAALPLRDTGSIDTAGARDCEAGSPPRGHCRP